MTGKISHQSILNFSPIVLLTIALLAAIALLAFPGGAAGQGKDNIPRVGQPVIDQVTHDSIAFHWPAVDGAEGYQVRWWEADDKKNTRQIRETVANSITLTDLKPETEYVVRALLREKGKTRAQTASPTAWVTTLAVPLPPVGALTAASVSHDRIRITWEAVADAEDYWVQWWEASGNSGRLHSAATAANSYTLTGLKADTEYVVWVMLRENAKSQADTASPQLRVTTASKSAPAARQPQQSTGPTVGALTAASVSHDRIRITWGAVADAEDYQVQWWEASGNSGHSRSTATAATFHTLTGLKPATEYGVRVMLRENRRAQADTASPELRVATASRPAPVAQQTQQSTGPTVGALTAASVGHDRIRVSWAAVAGAEDYRVQWWEASGNAGVTVTDATAANFHTITGLKPATEYVVRVMLRENGKSRADTASPELRVTTASQPAPVTQQPPPSTGPTVGALASAPLGTDRIRVSWATVAGAEDYHVQWWEASGNAARTGNAATAANFHVIAGLKADTEYVVRVMLRVNRRALADTTSPELRVTTPAAPNRPATGKPAISGTAQVDQTLTADVSGIADADGLGAFGYQWYADGTAIAGATGVSLTLTEAEQGKAITVTISYTDGTGYAETLTGPATAPVAALPPEPSADQPKSQLGETFVEALHDAVDRAKAQAKAGSVEQFVDFMMAGPQAQGVGGGQIAQAPSQAMAQGQQAEPQQQPPPTPPPATSVVYVIDDSGSLDGDFPEVRTALGMVRDETGMANTKVALIAFGTDPKTLFGLTDQATAPWNTHINSFGGLLGATNCQMGLTAAKSMLDADAAVSKKIVLMTDGECNRDIDEHPATINALKTANIVVDSVLFGENRDRHYWQNPSVFSSGTGGTHRDVPKPKLGISNTPPVTARGIAEIMAESVAADTTTLVLVDVSYSLDGGGGNTVHSSLFHQGSTAMRNKGNGIATARLGMGVFAGDYTGMWIGFAQASTFSRGLGNWLVGIYTDIDDALIWGHGQVAAQTATNKRVLLFSDGISPFPATAETLKKYTDSNIPIDVVAWGRHADRVYLKSIADATSGNFNVPIYPP